MWVKACRKNESIIIIITVRYVCYCCCYPVCFNVLPVKYWRSLVCVCCLLHSSACVTFVDFLPSFTAWTCVWVCLHCIRTHTIFIHRSFIGFTWLTVYANHALTSMFVYDMAISRACFTLRFTSGAYTFPCCFHLCLLCCMLFVAVRV